MADEQIVYLSPDEEITRALERLAAVQAHRIILVIPAQTLLTDRSAWILLRERMRQLQKSVHVISADRRIQSVAKLAGFHVTASLASAPPSRPAAPGRNASPVKHAARSQTRSGRRPSPPVSPATGDANAPFSVPSAQDAYRSRQPSQNLGAQLPSSAPSYPPRAQDDEDAFDMPQAASDEPFEETGQQYHAHYGYNVNAAPVFPLSHYASDDDDEDPLVEDFHLAQGIRQSAGLSSAGGARPQPPSIDDDDDEVAASTSSVASPGMQAPQAASASANESAMQQRPVNPEPDTLAGSAAGVPGVPAPTPPPARARSAFASPSAGMADPKPFSLPMPGQSSRAGQPQRPQLPQPQNSGPARSNNGWVFHWPRLNLSRSTPRQVRGGLPVAKRRSSPFELPLLLGLVILFIFGLLAYFVPSATVTIALAAQAYSVPVQLTATADSKQNLALHTAPARALVYDTSVQGQGKATGSVPVGMNFAEGTVIFTYTGPGSIDIPSGIIVATSSNEQFVTQADTQVVPGVVLATPIIAQTAGGAANVDPNTVTIIPASSLTQLQKLNPYASINASALTVINKTSITGGGATDVPAVSSSDTTTEKALLDQQLQALVQAWLQKQANSGDVLGNPVRNETLTTRPAPGVPDKDAQFTATLSLHLTALAVRVGDLQAAATAEFNHTLHQKQPGLVLLPGQQVSITQRTSTASPDGSSLTISLIAVGQVGKLLPADSVRSLITGKNVAEARQSLLANDPRQIKNARIVVYPGITPWVPFFARRIDVFFVAAPAPSPAPPAHPKTGPSKP